MSDVSGIAIYAEFFYVIHRIYNYEFGKGL